MRHFISYYWNHSSTYKMLYFAELPTDKNVNRQHDCAINLYDDWSPDTWLTVNLTDPGMTVIEVQRHYLLVYFLHSASQRRYTDNSVCTTLKLLLFHDPLPGTTQVSRYEKDKPFWILLKQTWWGGSGYLMRCWHGYLLEQSAVRFLQVGCPS